MTDVPNSAAYMDGRRRYARPQALLFSDNPGELAEGENFYIPSGTEFINFIILSDHNREPISMKLDRIETRKRMINGRMRSYHLADKLKINTSWKNLPSRSATNTDYQDAATPGAVLDNGIFIDSSTGKPIVLDTRNDGSLVLQNPYVVDRGAAGSDLLRWYENNPGSFYVWIAYDKPEYSTNRYDLSYFQHYAEIKECFFSSFDYTISKRSGIYDFWDVSLELEEA